MIIPFFSSETWQQRDSSCTLPISPAKQACEWLEKREDVGLGPVGKNKGACGKRMNNADSYCSS